MMVQITVSGSAALRTFRETSSKAINVKRVGDFAVLFGIDVSKVRESANRDGSTMPFGGIATSTWLTELQSVTMILWRRLARLHLRP